MVQGWQIHGAEEVEFQPRDRDILACDVDNTDDQRQGFKFVGGFFSWHL